VPNQNESRDVLELVGERLNGVLVFGRIGEEDME